MMMTVLLLVAGILLLANAVNSKTAFILLLGMPAVMAMLSVVNPENMPGIIVMAILSTVGILLADNAGILA